MPTKPQLSPRKGLDWQKIEREYSAGQLSVCEIARQHGCSESLIRRKATEQDWARDLSGVVRERVNSELAKGDICDDVREESSRESVRASAARGVEVVRQHRKSAARGQRVVLGLLAELESAAAYLPELEEEINATMKGLPRVTAQQAITIGARAKAAQALASALAGLVAVERKAFALDADPGELPPSTARDAALLELRRLGLMEGDDPPGQKETPE